MGFYATAALSNSEGGCWTRRMIPRWVQPMNATALASFGKKLEDERILPSMGRVGSAYANALAESFVATLKTELLYRSGWSTRQVARTAVFEYIECFYNSRRCILPSFWTSTPQRWWAGRWQPTLGLNSWWMPWRWPSQR